MTSSAVRITNIAAILDPWLEAEPSSDKRQSVLEAILKAADKYDVLFQEPAAFGHPLKRAIEVPEAQVMVRVLLPHPNRGIHLLGIDPI